MARDLKIVSGGQTGVDRAALDLALKLGIEHGGWCPKGRLAEDGVIDSVYQLDETPLEDVDQRTEWNVRDSDGTLIVSIGEPLDGTVWTLDCVKKHQRPYLEIWLDKPLDSTQFLNWMDDHQIKVLNIAGPRESHMPGTIYTESYQLLSSLLEQFR